MDAVFQIAGLVVALFGIGLGIYSFTNEANLFYLPLAVSAIGGGAFWIGVGAIISELKSIRFALARLNK